MFVRVHNDDAPTATATTMTTTATTPTIRLRRRRLLGRLQSGHLLTQGSHLLLPGGLVGSGAHNRSDLLGRIDRGRIRVVPVEHLYKMSTLSSHCSNRPPQR